MIRALAFDLDQTLVQRDQAFQRFVEGEQALAPDRPLDLARVAALDQHGYGPKEPLLAYIGETLGWTEHEHTQRQQRFVRGLLASVTPDARVIALLERLRGSYQLGLITNGSSQTQRGKLERSGLAPYFPVALVSEELGIRKPDPRIFTQLLSLLELPPSEVVFIGDDPEKDVLGAASVGITPIWIAAGRQWSLTSPAPRTIESVLQLEACLQS